MSGGRFDYQNERLAQIAKNIEFDLANNNHVNSEISENEVWGLNWKPETLVYVRRMLQDVKNLNRLLHEYDFAVCDDTCEDEFLKEAKAIYGDLIKPEKPAAVPWEASNIGDVVEIDCEDDGRHNVVVVSCDGMDWPDRCTRCACGRYEWSCPGVPGDDDIELCSSHPSGCDVYFMEVKE